MELNFWATPDMKALFQSFLLIYYVFRFGPWAEYESAINAASHFFLPYLTSDFVINTNNNSKRPPDAGFATLEVRAYFHSKCKFSIAVF